MAEKVKVLQDKAKEYWSNLDKKNKKKIILFTILFAISIAVAGVVLNTTEYTVLYTGLDLKEAGEIVTILKDLNVETKSSGDGTILINKKKEDNVRMQLAMQGYPKTGLNYDLFQNSMNLTTSSQDKSVILIYQLQDRLSSTVSQLQGIKNAIVTISAEEEDVFKFKSENTPVSACVVLELENYFDPKPEQIKAIQRLMVTSISGLEEENVAIIDADLHDLTPANNNDPYTQPANNRLQVEQKIEKQISDKVLYLFGPVFGDDNIKVGVNVSVNFDKKFTEMTEYTPVIDDEGIPYIVDELSEKVTDSTQNSGQVNSSYSVASDSLNDRMQKVIQYRVNELKQTIDEAEGNVEDISLSILINNIEMDNSVLNDVKKLASAAVGIDSTNVTVGYMEFTARNGLEDKLDKALSGSEKGGLPISDKALVALIAVVLAFVFGLIVLRFLRAPAKKQEEQSEQLVDDIAEDKQLVEGLLTEDDQTTVEINYENNKDKELIKEIESAAELNSKELAQIVSYWLKEDNNR